MLAALGFGRIAVFLAAIMTKRLSVLVALILVPVVFALIGGFAPQLGKFMADGIVQVGGSGCGVGRRLTPVLMRPSHPSPRSSSSFCCMDTSRQPPDTMDTMSLSTSSPR